jgi:ribose 5-phosphate isomerase A
MATAPLTEDPAAHFKKAAGEYAANLVEAGMVVGLGTGSTAIHAVRRIAARLHAGELPGVVGVATSLGTLQAARELGIPLLDDDLPRAVDITIDGADEVDPAFNAIKGGEVHCCVRRSWHRPAAVWCLWSTNESGSPSWERPGRFRSR